MSLILIILLSILITANVVGLCAKALLTVFSNPYEELTFRDIFILPILFTYKGIKSKKLTVIGIILLIISDIITLPISILMLILSILILGFRKIIYKNIKS